MAVTTRKAAGVESGGLGESDWSGLGCDRVGALAVLALGGYDGQPQLFADRTGQEAAYGMRLPAGGAHEFFR